MKQVHYPKYSPTRAFYDRCKRPTGGYGGLLSATFYSTEDATKFFDHLDTAKGPSLGTNFTLRLVALIGAPERGTSVLTCKMNSSPYVLLAHFTELDWVSSSPL